MFTENVVLNFCFMSDPDAYSEDIGRPIRKFTAKDLNAALGIKATFHFDAGEHNFLSGHGNAQFSFWTVAFQLSPDEVSRIEYNTDEAIACLMNKLQGFLNENGITAEQIKEVTRTFDCRALVMLNLPKWMDGGIFAVHPDDLGFMSETGLTFEHWPFRKEQIETLKRSGIA
ncbi:hypothetical protein [Bhargavaea cecembensis]|uniref:hypothetical protein n=1 Tax=Bhargavaea cecembensis TaxID=394098 RepID=UPI0011775863|nr:hypothetical protein [Bhargavaea cecembensis]